MLRFLPVVMLIPFPILNSLSDCLEFGVHYSSTCLTLRRSFKAVNSCTFMARVCDVFLGTYILPLMDAPVFFFALGLQLNRQGGWVLQLAHYLNKVEGTHGGPV